MKRKDRRKKQRVSAEGGHVSFPGNRRGSKTPLVHSVFDLDQTLAIEGTIRPTSVLARP
jgi:hypothetical protein